MVHENFPSESLNAVARRKKSPAIFISLILFFGIVVFLSRYLLGNSESTKNAQIEGHIVNVASRIDGQVSKVFIDNDTIVKEGDPLVLLDNTLQHANVEIAQADFDAAIAAFKQATVDIKQARATFMSAHSTKDLEYKINIYKIE